MGNQTLPKHSKYLRSMEHRQAQMFVYTKGRIFAHSLTEYCCATSKYLLLLVIVFAFPRASFAQQKDFFNQNGQFLSLYRQDPMDVAVRYDREFERKSSDGELEYERSSVALAGELLHAITTSRFIRAGFRYHYRQYDFSADRGTEFGERSFDLDLHRAALRFGAGQFIGERLLVTGFADIGAASNFEDGISIDAARLEFQAEAVFEFNPATQLLLGLRRGYEFEDFSTYPILGMRLIDTEGRLRVRATLPIDLQVNYRLSPIIDSYAALVISGDEYEIAKGPSNQEGSLEVYNRRLGVGLTLLPGKTFVFGIETGLGIEETLDFDFDRTVSSPRDIDIGPYISVSIGLTL